MLVGAALVGGWALLPLLLPEAELGAGGARRAERGPKERMEVRRRAPWVDRTRVEACIVLVAVKAMCVGRYRGCVCVCVCREWQGGEKPRAGLVRCDVFMVPQGGSGSGSASNV